MRFFKYKFPRENNSQVRDGKWKKKFIKKSTS